MQIIHDSSAKKPMQVVDDGKEEKLKAFDAEEALETASKKATEIMEDAGYF